MEISAHAEPAKLDSIRDRLMNMPGVQNVSFNATLGAVEISYSGTYGQLEEIEAVVDKLSSAAVLISPVPVRFRPATLRDEAGLVAALKKVAGALDVIRDSSGFVVFVPLGQLDLKAILKAAEGSGQPGTIISHEEYELTCSLQGADRAKLKTELEKLKYILRADLVENEIRVVAIKGKTPKGDIRRVATQCGATFKSFGR